MPTHHFLIGGGGYYGPQGGPNRMLMEVLRTTGKKHPKVCLIPTATGDQMGKFLEFADIINRIGGHPNFLMLYHVPTRDLEDWVMDFDAFFISGGNTRNLIAIWREWELDRMLIKAMQKGAVVSGASAGANCWYEESSSDFIPGEYNPLKGLGLLKGSYCPHYGDEKNRRESYMTMVKEGRLKDGYACTDRAALHYVDGEMKEALVEWDQAGAYRVERAADGGVTETKLAARTV
jgi:dipeptidase E